MTDNDNVTPLSKKAGEIFGPLMAGRKPRESVEDWLARAPKGTRPVFEDEDPEDRQERLEAADAALQVMTTTRMIGEFLTETAVEVVAVGLKDALHPSRLVEHAFTVMEASDEERDQIIESVVELNAKTETVAKRIMMIAMRRIQGGGE